MIKNKIFIVSFLFLLALAPSAFAQGFVLPNEDLQCAPGDYLNGICVTQAMKDSACPANGNGKIEPWEVCDPGIPRYEFCSTGAGAIGYRAINCNATCTQETPAAACTAIDVPQNFTETDPKVGTLTNGKVCTSDGALVNCDADFPALTESDPKIGTLTNGKFCTTDGIAVNCITDLPSPPAETDPKIGTLGTAGQICTTDGNGKVNCTTDATASAQVWQSTVNPAAAGVYYNGGNVGIGTNAPAEAVEIASTAGATSRLRVTDVDAGQNPEMQLQFGPVSTDHWKFYVDKASTPANALKIWGGSDRLTLASNGNIGIGTSSPATALTIAGTGSISNWSSYTGSPKAHLTLSDATGNSAITFTSTSQNMASMIWDPVNNDLKFEAYYPSGATSHKQNVLVLDSQTGNIGIGTATPNNKLEVAGSVRVGQLLPTNAGNTAPSAGSLLQFSSGAGYASFADNTDPVWIRRYDTTTDQSSLQISVGDNDVNTPTAQDYFQIGKSPSGSFSPVFSVNTSTGDVATTGNIGIGAAATLWADLQVNSGSIAVTSQGDGLILPETDDDRCRKITISKRKQISVGDRVDCATGQPVPFKRAFFTSTQQNGNLGGLSGANAICQTRANAASLGGTWKAWISTTTVDAITNITTHHDGPYYETGGREIAADWNDLITRSSLSISRDEFGNTVPSGSNTALVWTYTEIDGTKDGAANSNCSNWTLGTSSGFIGGRYGVIGNTGSGWTNYGISTCDNAFRLYCFEQ